MKKLNLEQLELQLPKIHEKNSKILLGGTGYGEFEAPQCHGGDLTCGDGGNSNNNNNNNNQQDDYSDGSYDLDYGLDDNYQDLGDYGYDQDGNVGDTGNNSGTTGITITPSAIMANFPPTFLNGVGLMDYPVTFDSTVSYEESLFATDLQEQMKVILETNSVIAQFLDEIDQRGIGLTFHIGDVLESTVAEGANTLATTDPAFQFGTTTITMDITDSSPDGGWTDSSHGDNPYESLVHTMLHEVFHARIAAIFQEAYQDNQDPTTGHIDHNGVYAQVLASHGAEMASIYYDVDPTTGNAIPITDNQEIADNHHDYMETHYGAEYEAAIEEFNNDINELRSHLNQLQNDFQTKLNELQNMGTPSPEELQDYENLRQEVENLEYEINFIQVNYGELLNL